MQPLVQAEVLPAMFGDFPDPVFVKDLELRYTYVNRAYLKSLGMEEEDVLGQRVEDLLPSASASLCEQMDRRALAGRVQQTEETIELHGNRFQRSSFTLAPNRSPDGSIVGMVGMVRDVTQRYHRELNLVALAEFASGEDARKIRTVCASCKRMKSQQDWWYVCDPAASPAHADKRLSHSICECCVEKLYDRASA